MTDGMVCGMYRILERSYTGRQCLGTQTGYQQTLGRADVCGETWEAFTTVTIAYS